MLVPRESIEPEGVGPESVEGEKDRERASRAAQQVRRAATVTAELAAQSEREASEVCSHPPGLYDQPTPLSLSTSETAASKLPPTPVSRGGVLGLGG